MAGGQTTTTGRMCKDLEDLTGWIAAIRGVMDHLDQGISVSTESWDPPGGIRPPICVPKCLPPPTGANPPTSIADLVQLLEYLRNWAAALGETLGRLPDTPIPPPEP
jgi:hypothetical protein